MYAFDQQNWGKKIQFYGVQSAKGTISFTSLAETNRRLSGIAERVALAIRTRKNEKITKWTVLSDLMVF